MLFSISRVQATHQSRKRGRADGSDEFDFFDDTSMPAEELGDGAVEEAPLTVSTARDGPSPGDVDDSFVSLTALPERDKCTRSARHLHFASKTFRSNGAASRSSHPRRIQWQSTPFSASDCVADIPGRPGEVAFRSTSVGGKGDSVIVIPTSRYKAAVALFQRRGDFPQTTDGVEDDPVPGAIRGGKGGVPKHMRTDRLTAVTAPA